MQIIYKAADITEAHIVAGLLNANGIEAHVGGHYLQGAIGEMAAFDFANVQVADEDIPLAQSLIADYAGKQDKPVDHTASRKYTLTSRVLIALLVFSVIIFIFYLVSL